MGERGKEKEGREERQRQEEETERGTAEEHNDW